MACRAPSLYPSPASGHNWQAPNLHADLNAHGSGYPWTASPGTNATGCGMAASFSPNDASTLSLSYDHRASMAAALATIHKAPLANCWRYPPRCCCQGCAGTEFFGRAPQPALFTAPFYLQPFPRQRPARLLPVRRHLYPVNLAVRHVKSVHPWSCTLWSGGRGSGAPPRMDQTKNPNPNLKTPNTNRHPQPRLIIVNPAQNRCRMRCASGFSIPATE